MAQTFTKDPNAILDYKFDWSDWLATGETISTKTIVVVGVTEDSSSITNSGTSVTVWVSGGTRGRRATVACKIATSASRTDERTITLFIENR